MQLFYPTMITYNSYTNHLSLLMLHWLIANCLLKTGRIDCGDWSSCWCGEYQWNQSGRDWRRHWSGGKLVIFWLKILMAWLHMVWLKVKICWSKLFSFWNSLFHKYRIITNTFYERVFIRWPDNKITPLCISYMHLGLHLIEIPARSREMQRTIVFG